MSSPNRKERYTLNRLASYCGTTTDELLVYLDKEGIANKFKGSGRRRYLDDETMIEQIRAYFNNALTEKREEAIELTSRDDDLYKEDDIITRITLLSSKSKSSSSDTPSKVADEKQDKEQSSGKASSTTAEGFSFVSWREAFTRKGRDGQLTDNFFEGSKEKAEANKSKQLTRVLFIFSTLVVSIVMFLFASASYNWPISMQEAEIMRIFLSIICICWLSYSLSRMSNAPGGIFKIITFVTIISLPILVMLSDPGSHIAEVAFWVTIIMWTSFAVLGVTRLESGWHTFTLVIGVMWSVSGFIISIGNLTPLFSFSQLALERLDGISRFLDFRIVLALTFWLSLLLLAIIRNEKRREVYEMNPFRAPIVGKRELGAKGKTALYNPFFESINTILLLVTKVVEVIVHIVKGIVSYLHTLGQELYSCFKEIVFKRTAYGWVITILLSFTLLLVMFTVIKELADETLTYIKTSQYNEAFPAALLIIGGVGGVTICIMNLLRQIQGKGGEAMKEALPGLLSVIMMFFISGIILYILHFFDSDFRSLEIQGYDKPGLFTLSVLFLIVLGVISKAFGFKFKAGQRKKGSI